MPAPSAAEPALVWVFPGVYQETPLIVPTGVVVDGQSPTSTIVEAATPTAALVTLEAGANLRRVQLRGADGAGGIGLLCNSAGRCVFNDVTIVDCETGLRATGANVLVVGALLAMARAPGATMTTGVEILAGARVVIATRSTVTSSARSIIHSATDPTPTLVFIGISTMS